MKTFDVVVSGDRIEWLGERPEGLAPGSQLRGTLSVDPEDSATPADWRERQAAAFAALDRLARLGGASSIPDPVAWQREIREDRPLPGREP